jgi:hypothetical protein
MAAMSLGPPFTRRQVMIEVTTTVLIALMCAGLAAAAALVPAPGPAVPFVVGVSVVLPMLSTWQCSAAFAGLRRGSGRPLDEAALGQLRRELDQLPETGHPLGL